MRVASPTEPHPPACPSRSSSHSAASHARSTIRSGRAAAAGSLMGRGTPCLAAATCGERRVAGWGRGNTTHAALLCPDAEDSVAPMFALQHSTSLHASHTTPIPPSCAQRGVRPPLPRLHRPLHRAAAGGPRGPQSRVQRVCDPHPQPAGAGAAAGGRAPGHARRPPAAGGAAAADRRLERAHLRLGQQR